MKIYAELAPHRVRQVALDALALGWIALWVWVGLRLHDLVSELAAPGRTLVRAGRGMARPLEDAGSRVADVPVVGDALREPLEGAARASSMLAQAGAHQQDAVQTLALWLGLLFALVPIALGLARYVPMRVGWVRDASAAHRVRLDDGALELFALRAVATRPLHELRRAAANPARAWIEGDHASLAALELETLGLRAPPHSR
jgi:hypothetical protein